ncbi:penicillin binding protein PBP4B [Glaciecola sp. 1036]|uniref:penicillin binding protein PBP4B n=1 Tax=Alteromonadaceae TaxID=72275 RepID=UPI003CFF00E1
MKFTRFLCFTSILLLLQSCSSSRYEQLPSENYSFRVKSLVLHFTAIDYATSVKYLVDKGHVSSHYLVPEKNDPSYPYSKLEVFQLVDENERAWHAGVSYWQGRTGLNDTSIGIEIVNVPSCINQEDVPHYAQFEKGQLCVFPDYDPEQIELVIQLSKDILSRHPDIEPTAVIGHSDIAPSRKNDPGPRFPWYRLYQEGVGAWYEKDTLAKYWQMFSKHPVNLGLLQKALSDYGYGITETGVLDSQTIDTISAFQMHFLPWQVTGKADESTAAAIFSLIEKYFPNKLTSLMERYEEEVVSPPTPIEIQAGQLDLLFPLQYSKTRPLMDNKADFFAYKGKGEMRIQATQDTTADIYINGEKLNLTLPFSSQMQSYNLGKRTHTGLNTLEVRNIAPEDTELNIQIDYPEISLAESVPYDFSEVDALIQEDIDNGFPGAVLLVLKDGKIIKHSAYGYQKRYDENGMPLANPQPMQKDTMFDLASNTKTFATTLAIMHLVDQGKISLQAPISHYLPEYSGGGRDSRTVASLLSHASGYASEVQFHREDNRYGKAFFSQNRQYTANLLMQSVPLNIGNYVKQTYSDTNFMILGLLVERVTGVALDAYVENFLYTPLGLTSTKFTPLLKGHFANEFAATEYAGNTRGGRITFDNIREYTLQGEVHDEKAFYAMQGVAGHAGLFSNAKEMAVLAQALLNGGGYGSTHLFDHSTLNRFVHPHHADDKFGLGWRLANVKQNAWHFGPYASANAFGHTGWTGIATVIDPDLDLAVILLTNKKHSPIEGTDTAFGFTGDSFATGKYGSVMTLVYEAILHHKNNKKN